MSLEKRGRFILVCTLFLLGMVSFVSAAFIDVTYMYSQFSGWIDFFLILVVLSFMFRMGLAQFPGTENSKNMQYLAVALGALSALSLTTWMYLNSYSLAAFGPFVLLFLALALLLFAYRYLKNQKGGFFLVFMFLLTFILALLWFDDWFNWMPWRDDLLFWFVIVLALLFLMNLYSMGRDRVTGEGGSSGGRGGGLFGGRGSGPLGVRLVPERTSYAPGEEININAYFDAPESGSGPYVYLWRAKPSYARQQDLRSHRGPEARDSHTFRAADLGTVDAAKGGKVVVWVEVTDMGNNGRRSVSRKVKLKIVRDPAVAAASKDALSFVLPTARSFSHASVHVPVRVRLNRSTEADGVIEIMLTDSSGNRPFSEQVAFSDLDNSGLSPLLTIPGFAGGEGKYTLSAVAQYSGGLTEKRAKPMVLTVRSGLLRFVLRNVSPGRKTGATSMRVPDNDRIQVAFDLPASDVNLGDYGVFYSIPDLGINNERDPDLNVELDIPELDDDAPKSYTMQCRFFDTRTGSDRIVSTQEFTVNIGPNLLGAGILGIGAAIAGWGGWRAIKDWWGRRRGRGGDGDEETVEIVRSDPPFSGSGGAKQVTVRSGTLVDFEAVSRRGVIYWKEINGAYAGLTEGNFVTRFDPTSTGRLVSGQEFTLPPLADGDYTVAAWALTDDNELVGFDTVVVRVGGGRPGPHPPGPDPDDDDTPPLGADLVLLRGLRRDRPNVLSEDHPELRFTPEYLRSGGVAKSIFIRTPIADGAIDVEDDPSYIGEEFPLTYEEGLRELGVGDHTFVISSHPRSEGRGAALQEERYVIRVLPRGEDDTGPDPWPPDDDSGPGPIPPDDDEGYKGRDKITFVDPERPRFGRAVKVAAGSTQQVEVLFEDLSDDVHSVSMQFWQDGVSHPIAETTPRVKRNRDEPLSDSFTFGEPGRYAVMATIVYNGDKRDKTLELSFIAGDEEEKKGKYKIVFVEPQKPFYRRVVTVADPAVVVNARVTFSGLVPGETGTSLTLWYDGTEIDSILPPVRNATENVDWSLHFTRGPGVYQLSGDIVHNGENVQHAALNIVVREGETPTGPFRIDSFPRSVRPSEEFKGRIVVPEESKGSVGKVVFEFRRKKKRRWPWGRD